MINSRNPKPAQAEIANEICKVLQSRRLECVQWWEHLDRCRLFAHRPKEDSLEIRVTVGFAGEEFEIEIFSKESSQRSEMFNLDTTTDLLTKVRAHVHKAIALLDWSE